MKGALIVILMLLLGSVAFGYWVLWMPGRNLIHRATASDQQIKTLIDELKHDVTGD